MIFQAHSDAVRDFASEIGVRLSRRPIGLILKRLVSRKNPRITLISVNDVLPLKFRIQCVAARRSEIETQGFVLTETTPVTMTTRNTPTTNRERNKLFQGGGPRS